MTKSKQVPIADEVPWSTKLTAYDEAHFVVYLCLLDAKAKGATDEEMVQIILEMDPAKSAESARRAMKSHLERTRWMTSEGYRGLFSDD